jgi:integrase
MYQKRGAYYFVGQDNIWQPLGRDYPEALKKYAAILAGNAPGHTIELLWAKYQVEVLPNLAKKTQSGRRNDMTKPLEVFGQMNPQDVEPHHIWTYWRERGETEQARHEIRAFSALMTYARQSGARKGPENSNPCFKLGLPGAKARDLYVTDAAFYAVRDVAPTMLGYAMDLAWCAGLDSGTIRLLEWRNVTKTGLLFERGKTQKLQQIDGDDLVTILRQLRQQRPQVRRSIICARNGRPYTADGFQSAWQDAMAKAIKLKRLKPEDRYHFHDIRAKGGSEADSDEAAADLLGHADKRVTRKHYRRLPQRSQAIQIRPKSV